MRREAPHNRRKGRRGREAPPVSGRTGKREGAKRPDYPRAVQRCIGARLHGEPCGCRCPAHIADHLALYALYMENVGHLKSQVATLMDSVAEMRSKF